MAMGLSFTAATLCAEYRLVFKWVEKEDWSALSENRRKTPRFSHGDIRRRYGNY